MADSNVVSPLTTRHLADINRALDQLDIAEQQADMASRAGIDVAPQQLMMSNTRKQLLAIKQVYFPGQ